jgi:DNA repair exonuclease SbcCD ATPase subunit
MREKPGIQRVKELKAKKIELEEKLKKLEAKKNETRPHVFQKVHSEYTQKLEKVLSELEEKKEEINSFIETLKTKKEEYEKKKSQLEDTIEEIKLRFEIGEFDERIYNNMMGEKEKDMKALESKIDALDKEINELLELIGEESATQEEELEEVETAVSDEMAEPEPEEALEIPSNVNEVDLGPAVEEETPETPEEVAEVTEKEEEAVEEKVEDELKDIEELLEELPAEEKSPEETQEIPINEKLLDELGKESKVEERGEIVCKKCGHKNPPDSWFCEECGAELIIELE